MILLIEATSAPGYLALYDQNRLPLKSKELNILGNESKQLISAITDFLGENDLTYNDIKNIVAVNGPGSFTGIRSISLYINTILLLYPHIFITELSFFDTFCNYPIVKASSKRDIFVLKKKNGIIEVMKNDDFILYCDKNQIKTIYGFAPHLEFDTIINDRNFDKIVQNIKLDNKKTLTPLYIKKPNIS